tara:strand:+ start:3857 stop:4153 length:297 start_codon:yes stop_codon:yes gene_type:complete
MLKLIPGQPVRPAMGDGSRGVIQIHTDTEDISIYGSVDNLYYTLIKNYPANTDLIESVELCPFMVATNDTAQLVATASLSVGTFGSSWARLAETRGRT